MAPDADKLRQRKQAAALKNGTGAGNESATTTTTQDRLCSLSNIKTTEICIDGIIYDIADFDHPGGSSIFMFGGNDVTVQYNMIHPYHTAKHLEKMKRVGKVIDFTTEYVCGMCVCVACLCSRNKVPCNIFAHVPFVALSSYKFDTPFEREIKREVFKIVRRGTEFATPGFLFRAALYICLYCYLQYSWITQGSSWLLAMVYGVAQALIGMNVQHDANHGAVSQKYPIVNDILGLGADFIGGSKWLWIEQHWTHHAYTNHARMDPDGVGAEPYIIFNDYPPEHAKRKWWILVVGRVQSASFGFATTWGTKCGHSNGKRLCPKQSQVRDCLALLVHLHSRGVSIAIPRPWPGSDWSHFVDGCLRIARLGHSV
jgi:acyl-lipid (7-3)-desaturase (Delta-4 desaturase)